MKKKLKKIITLFIMIILFLLGIIFTIYIILYTSINHYLSIESGDELNLKSIINKYPDLDWQFSIDLSSINEVKEYKFKVSYLFFTYNVTVNIKDTTPPVVVLKDLIRYYDEGMPLASDFVESIEEESSYVLEMDEIDYEVGEKQVSISVIDAYGNVTTKSTSLTVVEYNSQPSFTGLSDMVTEYGTKPDLYTGVTAYDERFGEISFEVDDSSVNYYSPGYYEITYTTTNSLGTMTTATRNIRVKEKYYLYQINNFPTYYQYPNYPNGCESVALYTLLKYYGVNTSPEEIVNLLKKGSEVHYEGNILYGGNPEIEFVGDPRDRHGYGVYQKPIIDVANQLKPGIIDYTGSSLSDVLNLVKNSIPVQVWVSINLQNTTKCVSWIYAETGETIDWICNMHSVVIVGYDNYNVIVSDPYLGSIVSYDKYQFEKIYNFLGRRAIYYAS